MSKTAIYGVFDNADKLISTIHKVRNQGIKIDDVVTPYAIEEVIEALELKTRMPVAAFFYGLFGMLATFGFLYWTSVINYPLVFGGKPQNTLSFVIVVFIMVIFITVLFTLITFFLREKKGPGAVPKYNMPGMTDDKYFIIISSKEADRDNIDRILLEGGAIEVTEQ